GSPAARPVPRPPPGPRPGARAERRATRRRRQESPLTRPEHLRTTPSAQNAHRSVSMSTPATRPPDASGGQGEGALDRLGGGAHAVGGPLDPRKLRRAAGDGQRADDRAGRGGDGVGGAGSAEGVLLAVVLEAARGLERAEPPLGAGDAVVGQADERLPGPGVAPAVMRALA